MEKKTILVIEDEKAMLDSYAEILENAGYSVLKADDGYKGLSVLEEDNNSIDLVLLDLMMMGIDGLEILKTIKDNKESYGNAPIVVLTNMTSEKVIEEAFNFGASAYLLKTEMDQQDLLTQVGKFLSK